MKQKDLQKELGMAMEKLSVSLKNNDFKENEIKVIQTMCSVAKQMVNNADIIIRASKMTGNKKACKELID